MSLVWPLPRHMASFRWSDSCPFAPERPRRHLTASTESGDMASKKQFSRRVVQRRIAREKDEVLSFGERFSR